MHGMHTYIAKLVVRDVDARVQNLRKPLEEVRIYAAALQSTNKYSGTGIDHLLAKWHRNLGLAYQVTCTLLIIIMSAHSIEFGSHMYASRGSGLGVRVHVYFCHDDDIHRS
jgi:hypothetical protein